MRRDGLLLIGLALVLAGCASSRGARPATTSVELSAAREAVGAARAKALSGSPQRIYQRAVGHLREAEKLARSTDREARRRSELLGQLAEAEAYWAMAAARSAEHGTEAGRPDRPSASSSTPTPGRIGLEERLALLERELELTETELIRTKARLKGIDTKAEATSSIAEARILMGRLDPGTQASVLRLCRDSLAKAEAQVGAENYGAAVFFALKAQAIATKGQ